MKLPDNFDFNVLSMSLRSLRLYWHTSEENLWGEPTEAVLKAQPAPKSEVCQIPDWRPSDSADPGAALESMACHIAGMVALVATCHIFRLGRQLSDAPATYILAYEPHLPKRPRGARKRHAGLHAGGR